jgi:hypothetical protein
MIAQRYQGVNQGNPGVQNAEFNWTLFIILSLIVSAIVATLFFTVLKSLFLIGFGIGGGIVVSGALAMFFEKKAVAPTAPQINPNNTRNFGGQNRNNQIYNTTNRQNKLRNSQDGSKTSSFREEDANILELINPQTPITDEIKEDFALKISVILGNISCFLVKGQNYILIPEGRACQNVELFKNLPMGSDGSIKVPIDCEHINKANQYLQANPHFISSFTHQKAGQKEAVQTSWQEFKNAPTQNFNTSTQIRFIDSTQGKFIQIYETIPGGIKNDEIKAYLESVGLPIHLAYNAKFVYNDNAKFIELNPTNKDILEIKASINEQGNVPPIRDADVNRRISLELLKHYLGSYKTKDTKETFQECGFYVDVNNNKLYFPHEFLKLNFLTQFNPKIIGCNDEQWCEVLLNEGNINAVQGAIIQNGILETDVLKRYVLDVTFSKKYTNDNGQIMDLSDVCRVNARNELLIYDDIYDLNDTNLALAGLAALSPEYVITDMQYNYPTNHYLPKFNYLFYLNGLKNHLDYTTAEGNNAVYIENIQIIKDLQRSFYPVLIVQTMGSLAKKFARFNASLEVLNNIATVLSNQKKREDFYKNTLGIILPKRTSTAEEASLEAALEMANLTWGVDYELTAQGDRFELTFKYFPEKLQETLKKKLRFESGKLEMLNNEPKIQGSYNDIKAVAQIFGAENLFQDLLNTRIFPGNKISTKQDGFFEISKEEMLKLTPVPEYIFEKASLDGNAYKFPTSPLNQVAFNALMLKNNQPVQESAEQGAKKWKEYLVSLQKLVQSKFNHALEILENGDLKVPKILIDTYKIFNIKKQDEKYTLDINNDFKDIPVQYTNSSFFKILTPDYIIKFSEVNNKAGLLEVCNNEVAKNIEIQSRNKVLLTLVKGLNGFSVQDGNILCSKATFDLLIRKGLKINHTVQELGGNCIINPNQDISKIQEFITEAKKIQNLPEQKINESEIVFELGFTSNLTDHKIDEKKFTKQIEEINKLIPLIQSSNQVFIATSNPSFILIDKQVFESLFPIIFKHIQSNHQNVAVFKIEGRDITISKPGDFCRIYVNDKNINQVVKFLKTITERVIKAKSTQPPQLATIVKPLAYRVSSATANRNVQVLPKGDKQALIRINKVDYPNALELFPRGQYEVIQEDALFNIAVNDNNVHDIIAKIVEYEHPIEQINEALLKQGIEAVVTQDEYCNMVIKIASEVGKIFNIATQTPTFPGVKYENMSDYHLITVAPTTHNIQEVKRYLTTLQKPRKSLFEKIEDDSKNIELRKPQSVIEAIKPVNANPNQILGDIVADIDLELLRYGIRVADVSFALDAPHIKVSIDKKMHPDFLSKCPSLKKFRPKEYTDNLDIFIKNKEEADEFKQVVYTYKVAAEKMREFLKEQKIEAKVSQDESGNVVVNIPPESSPKGQLMVFTYLPTPQDIEGAKQAIIKALNKAQPPKQITTNTANVAQQTSPQELAKKINNAIKDNNNLFAPPMDGFPVTVQIKQSSYPNLVQHLPSDKFQLSYDRGDFYVYISTEADVNEFIKIVQNYKNPVIQMREFLTAQKIEAEVSQDVNYHTVIIMPASVASKFNERATLLLPIFKEGVSGDKCTISFKPTIENVKQAQEYLSKLFNKQQTLNTANKALAPIGNLNQVNTAQPPLKNAINGAGIQIGTNINQPFNPIDIDISETPTTKFREPQQKTTELTKQQSGADIKKVDGTNIHIFKNNQ